MAVVDADEAATSPMGTWAMGRADGGFRPAAVCLRTDDIAAVAASLGTAPAAMSRLKPDGAELSWSLAGLEGMLGPSRLPFFIEWRSGDHPGASPADHRVPVDGIAAVTVGRASGIEPLLTDVPGLSVTEGTGVLEVVVATGSGPISFR